MKITCQSCQAKYTVADEKVLGKIVKIRCKKCSATIVVNGSGSPAAPEQPRAYADPRPRESEEPWTVNVADGDARTMAPLEIVSAYQSGVVTDDAYCWREGMNDWLPLRDIEQLYEACTATRMAPASSAPPPGARTRDADEGAGAYGGPLLNAPPRMAAASGNGSGGCTDGPPARPPGSGRARAAGV